jgi:hypothetical protein
MVEKEETSYDSVSTVMVDAIETHPSNTVGAAIAILEEKLAAKGISFQVPAGTSKSDLGKVDGKLLRLPMLIELAITHAIDTIEKATEKNVSEKVTRSIKKALVPGNVVALVYDSDNRFLSISGRQVSHCRFTVDDLPSDGNSERLLVVSAGSGCVSFYSPTSRRFLGFQDGNFSALGYPLVNADESPRANESFQVVDIRTNGGFHLRCPIEALKTKTGNGLPYLFSLFKIYGFD